MSSGAGMTVVVADCIEHMRSMDEHSVDAVVCDPPYGIDFMGKAWDRYSAREFEDWCASWAVEALRVLKPGGHLLAFGGTRTYHRLAAGIEDAGFEIRDCLLSVSGGGDAAEQSSGLLAWMYGSGRPGFPKSMNLDNLRGTVTCGCDETPEHDLPRLRHSDVPASVGTKGGQGQVLHEGVQEQGAPAAVQQLPATEVRPEQPGMEGRSDVLQEEGELREREVRPGSGVGVADGSQGRIHHGTPVADGGTLRVPTDQDGSGASRGPRPDEQQPEQLGTVADEREPQGGGAWPHCGRCGKPRLPRGWGTALKPAFEPVVVARKPLTGTVAATVLAHGTGALNIDGCRIGTDGGTRKGSFPNQASVAAYGDGLNGACDIEEIGKGRWPANVVLDEEAADLLDEQTGEMRDGVAVQRNLSDEGSRQGEVRVKPPTQRGADVGYGGSGGASRFFYVAKAGSRERSLGLPDGERSTHPTVKPVELMRWLIRLVTPPGGLVLDPFTGSGTTGVAAHLEGVEFVGIEREQEYAAIAEARIAWWQAHADAGARTDAVLKVDRDPAQLDLLGGEAA